MLKRALLFLSLISIQVSASDISGKWYKLPSGSLQMEPVLFLSPALFSQLQREENIKEGDPVLLKKSNNSVEARLYQSLRQGDTFSISKKTGKPLKLRSGINSFSILPAPDSNLTPRPLFPHHTKHMGNMETWKGFVIGAPHGDCDWYTGEIAESLNQILELPAVTSYSCRFPYRGIWYDCNRPLMKPPKNEGGVNGVQVKSQREWNRNAEKIYNSYQGALYNVAHPEELRIRFLLSLHGHDLSITLNNGQIVSKDVIEGVGIGFSHDQLREIKKFYKKAIKKYFKAPPPLYFGNLPEDQKFKVRGVSTFFTYSATGTRLSGSLKLDTLRYGLHLETPNSLRVNSNDRKKFTQFLTELFPYIKTIVQSPTRDHLTSLPFHMPTKEFVTIKESDFFMGSNNKQDWDNERPRHKVHLSNFKISSLEVTNQEFSEFLNQQLKEKNIFIQRGIVYTRKKNVVARLAPEFPLSQIILDEETFIPVASKENFPVIHVSYYGASLYAQTRGATLPTEAQWEKAASWNPKRRKKNRFATTDTSTISIEDRLPTYGDLDVLTRPVGQSNANDYGLYDMSGNVWEWTNDWYSDDIYKQRQVLTTDPTGPIEGTMKTIRGGSWNMGLQMARTTMRIGLSPHFTSASVGFRIVLPE